MISELISVIEKISPLVASSLTSPIGGLVVSLLEKTFGVTAEKLAETITSNAEAAAKIKTLEIEHQDILTRTNADLYKSSVDDRTSARNLMAQNPKEIYVLHFIAIVYTFGFFLYLSTRFLEPTMFDKEIFNDLLNVGMMIFSFYFGSSYKSRF